MSNIEKLGPYEIRGVLGKGAMGLVYRAYDAFLNREIALKTMMEQVSANDPGAKERFFREAKAAANLKHKHIVTIYGGGEAEGIPYIAMEIIDGIVLSSLMKKGELTLDQKLTIVKGTAEGLDYAHRGGVVHRDIKPANISVDTKDYSPKIMDFGIAKVAASDMTKTGMILGTINYMSPEQLKADKSLDGRSDLFAAGVILYELLMGKKPFTGDTITAVMYKIVHDQPEDLTELAVKFPEPIVGLVKKALAKDRTQRYQTGKEFAEDVGRVIEAVKKGTLESLQLEIAQAESTMGVDASAAAAATASPSIIAGQVTMGGHTSATSGSIAGRTSLTGQTNMQGGTQVQGAIGGQTMGGGTQSTLGGGTQATMQAGQQGVMTPGGTMATMGGMSPGQTFAMQPQPKPSKVPYILAALVVVGAGGFFGYKQFTKPKVPATVTVQVFPWAEFASLTDKSGKPIEGLISSSDTTPMTFSPQPGEYVLTMKVGGSGKEVKFEFTAESGKTINLKQNETTPEIEAEMQKLLTGTP